MTIDFQMHQLIIIERQNENLNYALDAGKCDTLPCENNATCLDGVNGYTCECTDQWLGFNCTGILIH